MGPEEHLREALRKASELPPKEAADRIMEVWSTLDDLRDMAESRLRLVVGALEVPVEGVLPQGWAQELDGLEFGGRPFPATIVTRAKRLMQCCVPILGTSGAHPEFDVLGPSRISVDWNGLSTFMRWTIAGCELPWPAVKMTCYQPAGSLEALQKFRFYDAKTVVAHLSTALPNP